MYKSSTQDHDSIKSGRRVMKYIVEKRVPYEMWRDSLKAADYFMENPVLGQFPLLPFT